MSVRVRKAAVLATAAAAIGIPHSRGVQRLLFANAMEEAVAERRGTERMAAASNVKKTLLALEQGDDWQYIVVNSTDDRVPYVDENELAAWIGEVFSPDTLYECTDLSVASTLPTLFWNVVWHAGGPAAVVDADCSVVECMRTMIPAEAPAELEAVVKLGELANEAKKAPVVRKSRRVKRQRNE